MSYSFRIRSSSPAKVWKREFINKLLRLPKLIIIIDGLISYITYEGEYYGLHRDVNVGPALIAYDTNGEVESKQYWICGTQCTEKGLKSPKFYDTKKPIMNVKYKISGKTIKHY